MIKGMISLESKKLRRKMIELIYKVHYNELEYCNLLRMSSKDEACS